MRLIDADALKKNFYNKEHWSVIINEKYIECDNFSMLDCIASIIDNAPTVPLPDFKEGYKQAIRDGKTNFVRPQGEWIEHYSKEMSEKGYFLCSKCKHGFQRFERGVRHSDLPWIDGQKYELHCIDNFCPNCGADMRGEK